MEQHNEKWGSRWGFLLATAGSAIGLGNIWKFPYITGNNGGAAFVCVYLLAILFVGLPLMIAELSLGRATACHPAWAFDKFTKGQKTPLAGFVGTLIIISGLLMVFFRCPGHAILLLTLGIFLCLKGWKTVGVITGVLAPFIIISYYGVIGGWTIIYVFKSFAGELNFADPAQGKLIFEPILNAEKSTWGILLSAHFAFVAAAAVVVFFGVQNGIEKSSKVLMPMLFILLGALVLRGISLPGASKGLKFFLSPDFSALRPESVLIAMGQAFFTLSLAMGITTTYGSYLKRDVNIVQSALTIIGLDTLAAVMAGIAVFSSVFAMGFDPAQGPGLVYMIVPSAFNKVPGNLGWLWNGLFFIMLTIAALTSLISLLEPLVNFAVRQFKISRHLAVILFSLVIYLFGLLSAFSCANWKNLPWLEKLIKDFFKDAGPSFFELSDSFASNWMLPLGGLAIAIFAGWIWGTKRVIKEVRRGTRSGLLDANILVLLTGLDPRDYARKSLFSPAVFWAVSIRWITPVLVVFAFLYCIGVI
ncbi:MAG: sodium-dependent transporter [Lentisphaeria bacterium]|nr:sodium-dependent transporter [Lentisphaeria bacterium]